MGQYFRLVNETKKEVVDPWKVGGGAKFYEWLYNDHARVLVWLLRRSREGGGGDVLDRDSYGTLGAWHGDRISLIGDYDESGLYEESQTYRDISWMVAEDYNDAAELQGQGEYRLAWEKSP